MKSAALHVLYFFILKEYSIVINMEFLHYKMMYKMRMISFVMILVSYYFRTGLLMIKVLFVYCRSAGVVQGQILQL